MTALLVTPWGADSHGPGAGDAQIETEHHLAVQAVHHSQLLPVALLAPTRRNISAPLSEALLFAGRAQPTMSPTERRVQRADAGRLKVALRHSRQDLVLLGAQHLHPADLDLFHRVTADAGVDLWLIPSESPGPALVESLERNSTRRVTPAEATGAWQGKPGHDQRRRPRACEAVLPLGSGVAAAPGCTRHRDAGGCVLSSFSDALICARTHSLAVRGRLHELSCTLPELARWNVLAAARDPFIFIERALKILRLSHEEVSKLTLGALSHDGNHLKTPQRTIDVPKHLRGVLTAHRDIRLAEGSTSNRPFCIPTDDRTRLRSPVT